VRNRVAFVVGGGTAWQSRKHACLRAIPYNPRGWWRGGLAVAKTHTIPYWFRLFGFPCSRPFPPVRRFFVAGLPVPFHPFHPFHLFCSLRFLSRTESGGTI